MPPPGCLVRNVEYDNHGGSSWVGAAILNSVRVNSSTQQVNGYFFCKVYDSVSSECDNSRKKAWSAIISVPSIQPGIPEELKHTVEVNDVGVARDVDFS